MRVSLSLRFILLLLDALRPAEIRRSRELDLSRRLLLLRLRLRLRLPTSVFGQVRALVGEDEAGRARDRVEDLIEFFIGNVDAAFRDPLIAVAHGRRMPIHPALQLISIEARILAQSTKL